VVRKHGRKKGCAYSFHKSSHAVQTHENITNTTRNLVTYTANKNVTAGQSSRYNSTNED